MGLTYSRDGAAASIAAMEQLLCEVRLKLFLPDETRSGRIVQQAASASTSTVVIKDEDDEPAVEPSAIKYPVIPSADKAPDESPQSGRSTQLGQ